MKLVKVKTADLIGAQLDWAVGTAAGCDGLWMWTADDGSRHCQHNIGGPFSPSSNWRDGGPIIERERIDLTWRPSEGWVAWDADMRCPKKGPTPLVAAMRAYVTSKLGDEVEAPA
jgi:hypothetical protein